MFAGLQKVLQPAGYHIMLAESQHHLEREEEAAGVTLLSYNLAAAVLLSVEHSQNAPQRADRRQHSGGEDRRRARRSDRHEHRHRLRGGDVSATQTVIASGYQNIGLLYASQEQWIFQQHLRGWHKALLRNHMSPHRVINAAQPASFSTGAQQLPEFLLAWPELDALVCASDELRRRAV